MDRVHIVGFADYMDSLHEPVNTLARIWRWPPEEGSLCDPKHVGVKEFYTILMCFLINMCMSWLLLLLFLSMHGSTMKLIKSLNIYIYVVCICKCSFKGLWTQFEVLDACLRRLS